MTRHDNDSRRFGYPEGVTDATRVRVLIECEGKTSSHEGQAQSFGWSIAPVTPSSWGLVAVSAPITHYEILEDKTGVDHG